MKHQKGKFADISFTPADVEQWTPDLSIGQGFRCTRGEFVTFWKQGRILRDVTSCLCACWILRNQHDLAGYITLFADKLTVTEAEEPLLVAENVPYESFPAVKIGLLATDARTRGVGKCLILWAISFVAIEIAPQLGVRFMTVDALFDPDSGYDISDFYRKFGFQYANPQEVLPPIEGFRTMYFDMLSLIRELAALAQLPSGAENNTVHGDC